MAQILLFFEVIFLFLDFETILENLYSPLNSNRGVGKSYGQSQEEGWAPGRVFPGSGSKILNSGFRAGLVYAPGSGYPDENSEFFEFFLRVKNGSQPAKSERLTKFSLNETICQ